MRFYRRVQSKAEISSDDYLLIISIPDPKDPECLIFVVEHHTTDQEKNTKSQALRSSILKTFSSSLEHAKEVAQDSKVSEIYYLPCNIESLEDDIKEDTRLLEDHCELSFLRVCRAPKKEAQSANSYALEHHRWNEKSYQWEIKPAEFTFESPELAFKQAKEVITELEDTFIIQQHLSLHS